MKAISKDPIEKQATDCIRSAIVGGYLKPGERLTEISLSEQLAVSRSTTRTALHQLALEGLIVQVPYTGWSVIDFNRQDIHELFTLRASLESLAVRLACENMSAQGAKRLRAAWQRLEREFLADNDALLTEADFALHMAIVQLSGHGRLEEHYRILSQQVKIFIASTNRLPVERPEVILENHLAIIDAIIAQQSAQAVQLIEHHILSEGERLLSQPEWSAE